MTHVVCLLFMLPLMTVNHMSSVLLFLPLACVDLGRVLCDKVRAHYDKIQQLLSLLLFGGMSKHGFLVLGADYLRFSSLHLSQEKSACS